MSKKQVAIIATVFIMTVTGFVLGKAVDAAIGSPGSQTDPLVTKSYIDSEVVKLQGQINTLKTEVNKLKSAK